MRIRAMPFVILMAVVVFAWPAPAQPSTAHNFVAHLSGDEEVPPVNTLAQGQAIFQLNKAGNGLNFLLLVANIEDVTQAHIHSPLRRLSLPLRKQNPANMSIACRLLPGLSLDHAIFLS